MTSNVVDQPAKANEDRLNMKAYADALTDFISNAQSPLTIALQGEWGSGKTSLMNALKTSLVDRDDAPYLGVWINTWQYALMSNPEEAILKILTGIVGQVSTKANTSEEERASLFRKVARVGGAVDAIPATILVVATSGGTSPFRSKTMTNSFLTSFHKSFAVVWQKLRWRSPRFCPIAFQ